MRQLPGGERRYPTKNTENFNNNEFSELLTRQPYWGEFLGLLTHLSGIHVGDDFNVFDGMERRSASVGNDISVPLETQISGRDGQRVEPFDAGR